MALYFQQVSLAALPANLLAAPAIAPIMWLGVLAAAAAQIAEPLAAPFTALAAPLLVYVQRVAHHTAATPLSVVDVNASPLVIVAGWAALAAAADSRCADGVAARATATRRAGSPRPARSGAGARARRRRRGPGGAPAPPPPARSWCRSSTSARATRR